MLAKQEGCRRVVTYHIWMHTAPDRALCVVQISFRGSPRVSRPWRGHYKAGLLVTSIQGSTGLRSYRFISPQTLLRKKSPYQVIGLINSCCLALPSCLDRALDTSREGIVNSQNNGAQLQWERQPAITSHRLTENCLYDKLVGTIAASKAQRV